MSLMALIHRPGGGQSWGTLLVFAIHLQAHHRAYEHGTVHVFIAVSLGVPPLPLPGRVISKVQLCHILERWWKWEEKHIQKPHEHNLDHNKHYGLVADIGWCVPAWMNKGRWIEAYI